MSPFPHRNQCSATPTKAKPIPCNNITCGGRNYEGKGYYNPVVNAELVHNIDYSTGNECGRAFYAEDGTVPPGGIKYPTIRSDALF